MRAGRRVERWSVTSDGRRQSRSPGGLPWQRLGSETRGKAEKEAKSTCSGIRSRRKRRKQRTSRRSRRPQASVATTLDFGGFKSGSCKRSTSELAPGCRVALRPGWPGLCSFLFCRTTYSGYQQHAFLFGFTGNSLEILSAGLAPGKGRPVLRLLRWNPFNFDAKNDVRCGDFALVGIECWDTSGNRPREAGDLKTASVWVHDSLSVAPLGRPGR